MTIKIIETIDNVLTNEERKPREHHYPSDGVRCPRQLWYQWNKIPKSNPIEPAQICKMRMGNAIHNELAKILQENPNADYTIEFETPFRVDIGLKHQLSGRIDAIITMMQSGEKIILEVKSSFGRGIQAIARSGKPDDDHIGQVAMYLKYNPFGINKAILYYQARDNAYRTEFNIELKEGYILLVDGKAIAFNLDKMIENYKLAEGDKLPDRPNDYKVIIKNGEIKEKCIVKGIEYKSSWQCRYCGHMDYCWTEEKAKSV
jgi:CRISPR/Cas system-associated exonuclease Cas4 (RecB family)